MKTKKAVLIIIVIILLLCSVAMIQKNKTTPQYEPSIEVAIEQNYTLQGQLIPSGNSISMNVYVERVIISSEEITIFQRYHLPEDVAFSGMKDIALCMKDGTVYDLWRDCKDKTVTHNDRTNEANTNIIFSKTIPLKEIEAIQVAGQKFEINSEINNENV